MGKPDDISQGAWDAGREIERLYHSTRVMPCPGLSELIARAIMTETEACARIIDARLQEIVQEHGDWEPDTNYTNLPEWAETVFEELEPLAKAMRDRAQHP